MKHLAAIALIAVTTLFAASSPSGASNSSTRVILKPTGTWAFSGLSPAESANVVADIAQATSAARPVLDLIDGSVAIDSYASKCTVGDACSHPERSAGRPWTIHLPHGTLAGTFPSQRFIVLHEIGHAVWALVFSQADRDVFATAAQAAFPGGQCIATNGATCAPLYEMFADEFARWAGDFASCMDTYYTPPLLSSSAFGAIVDRALAGRA